MGDCDDAFFDDPAPPPTPVAEPEPVAPLVTLEDTFEQLCRSLARVATHDGFTGALDCLCAFFTEHVEERQRLDRGRLINILLDRYALIEGMLREDTALNLPLRHRGRMLWTLYLSCAVPDERGPLHDRPPRVQLFAQLLIKAPREAVMAFAGLDDIDAFEEALVYIADFPVEAYYFHVSLCRIRRVLLSMNDLPLPADDGKPHALREKARTIMSAYKSADALATQMMSFYQELQMPIGIMQQYTLERGSVKTLAIIAAELFPVMYGDWMERRAGRWMMEPIASMLNATPAQFENLAMDEEAWRCFDLFAFVHFMSSAVQRQNVQDCIVYGTGREKVWPLLHLPRLVIMTSQCILVTTRYGYFGTADFWLAAVAWLQAVAAEPGFARADRHFVKTVLDSLA